MNVQINGQLANSTPAAIAVSGLPCPLTITLKSSAAGRKIELSTDQGGEYFTPQVDISSSATMQIVTVASPVTNIRFTGQASDLWYISATGAT